MLHTLRFSLQNAVYFIMLIFCFLYYSHFTYRVWENLNGKLGCQKVKPRRHFFMRADTKILLFNVKFSRLKIMWGARAAFFLIFVFFYILFCVVLCFVCVYMCIVLLPPGGYPIAVNLLAPQFYI
jgi:hypothetical protein